MSRHSQWVTLIGVAIAMFAAGSAYATNGYFTHGTGTKNKGMVGGGIALPQDSIDTVNNPAVAVLVGESMQLGAAVFSPRRSYDTVCTSPPICANGNGGAFTIGPNDLDSHAEYFVIPHFSRSWQQTETRAFAVSFYGRGGMNTTWKGGTATFDPDGPGPAEVWTQPGTFGGGDAGVDYSQAFIDLTWAWRINDRLSLGIAPVIGMQFFEAKGLMWFTGYTETFVKSGGQSGFPAANLSNNGHDFAYGGGLKVGMHAQLTEKTALGVMYQSRIYMTEFDDYADLFAEQGDMDVPANLKVGLTHHVNENFALNFDIEHTWYNDIAAPGNSIMSLFSCGFSNPDTSGCLGGDNGAGFGWQDMTTYKISTQWSNGGDWTWRAGYSHGDHPIPKTEMTFNILAPGLMEDHLTFGFTKKSGENREWNLAFMYAPNNSQSGLNNFDPTQTVTWEMDQYELELSYSWRY